MTFVEYRDKRVIVTGCSSGIGRATAAALVELGAEVIGMSRREPDVRLASFIALDLESASSIESAIAGLNGQVDGLFNCAGAPPMLSSAAVVKVNFLGPRMLTEHVVERMSPGSSIVNVSSSSGSGWRKNLPLIREFLASNSFEGGALWYEKNEAAAGHGYAFSKEAINVWTMQEAVSLITKGIRINTSSPGAVQTPLLEASEKVFPAEYLSATERPSGRRSTIQEQVSPLLFLNSTMASYVNGADLAVDGGHWASLSIEGSLW